MIRSILERLVREPLVLRNAVAGGIAIIAIFGVTVPDSTANTLIDFLGLLLPLLVATWSARAKVTPVADPTVPAGTEVSIEGTDRSIVVGG